MLTDLPSIKTMLNRSSNGQGLSGGGFYYRSYKEFLNRIVIVTGVRKQQ